MTSSDIDDVIKMLDGGDVKGARQALVKHGVKLDMAAGDGAPDPGTGGGGPAGSAARARRVDLEREGFDPGFVAQYERFTKSDATAADVWLKSGRARLARETRRGA